MKPCPPLQPLRDTSFRSGRGGPTVLLGPLLSYLSPTPPTPLYIFREGSSAFGSGSHFSSQEPHPEKPHPRGPLNTQLASPSPDGCGAPGQLPLRAEPPPQPRGPEESAPLRALPPAELSDPQLAPGPSGGMRWGWRYLRSHSCGRAGNCC